MSQLPNLLSVFRLLAAPVLGLFMLTLRFRAALLLVLVAAVSDLLDGYLARRTGSVSRLGTYLDPASDKVLLVTSFLCLGAIWQIPRWLVALVIGRDLVIVIGSLLVWRFRGRTDFTPLLLGKISTALQILTVLVILVGNSLGMTELNHVRIAVVAATALFTTLSGAGYIRRGIRMASRTG